MSRWFRVYEKMLHDPKVQRLSGDAFKTLINLWCIASENGGTLPNCENVAFSLRKTESQVRKIVTEFLACELLDELAPGVIAPHNWNERQYKSDVSNERVKRHRERHRNVTSAVTETPPETEADTDSESDKNAAALGADAVEQILEAIGVADNPNWYGHKPQLDRWLTEFGWDLELDVLPTVKRLIANMPRPPTKPRYFEQAIADAKAERMRPAPKGQVRPGASNERSNHHAKPESSLVAAGRRRIAELDAIIEAERAGAGNGAGGVPGSGEHVRLLSARGSG